MILDRLAKILIVVATAFIIVGIIYWLVN